MSGTTDDLKGRAKEAVGDLTDDDHLRREGKLDRAGGAVKEKAEDAKDWAKDKAEDAKDKAEDAKDWVKDKVDNVKDRLGRN